MAIRNVYCDRKGLFFKGEGFKFYIAEDAGLREHGKVVVTNIYCGQSGAGAVYLDHMNARRFASGTS